jgi:hypothetical protein
MMIEIVNKVRGVNKQQNINYNSIQCLHFYLFKHISKSQNSIFIIPE